MKAAGLFLIAVFLNLMIEEGTAVTLQQMYDAALPAQGYDKLIELQGSEIYTGGILISNLTVGIRGHGAIIDLQGGSISAQGTAVLEVDGCVIINGNSAIYAQESVTARISHCTLYGNQIGIHFMAPSGMVEVVNSILAHNARYGFASEETTYRVLHYMTAYNNLQGDYMEWCPG